jgi:hypothetical protein
MARFLRGLSFQVPVNKYQFLAGPSRGKAAQDFAFVHRFPLNQSHVRAGFTLKPPPRLTLRSIASATCAAMERSEFLPQSVSTRRGGPVDHAFRDSRPAPCFTLASHPSASTGWIPGPV